jgi:hypothetical protein
MRGVMANDRDRTLDEEGVPDLEGSLPEKAATGDPQEGVAPPGDKPRAAVDFGTTRAEERQGERLTDRIEREEPDVDGTRAGQAREQAQVADPHGTRDDDEKDLVGEAAPVDGALAPEEQALRVEEEP